MAALAQMKPVQMLPEIEGPITEDAAAQAFARRHEHELLFCHSSGNWYRWTGFRWQKETTGLAFHYARELARFLSESQPEKLRYITSKVSFASGVERFARVDRAFAVTGEVWDSDPMLLATPGGTIDLRSGQMRSASPMDRITKCVAVTPSVKADCPRWLKFLDEASGGDADLIRFLQQWMGYCLTGSTKQHALLFIHGGGGNGKSVFLNVTTGIMAEYACTAAMETFTATKGDKHSTDLAMLAGARLVTASETEEGRSWAEARIKSVTGGDPITARFMRQDNFTYTPRFKLLVVGNHKPVLANVDDAARRRFNIVPFDKTPTRPDPDLEAKLKAEWPGILRWMIEGCLDWQRNGLIRPAIVRSATERYFSDQDLFGQWLDDECDVDIGNWHKSETSASLFGAWSSYASNAGEKAGNRNTFSERMARRGMQVARGHGGTRLYRGIQIKKQTSWTDAHDR